MVSEVRVEGRGYEQRLVVSVPHTDVAMFNVMQVCVKSLETLSRDEAREAIAWLVKAYEDLE